MDMPQTCIVIFTALINNYYVVFYVIDCTRNRINLSTKVIDYHVIYTNDLENYEILTIRSEEDTINYCND